MAGRKGYKSIEEQMAANKRYLETHPEAKERRKIITTRSNAKKYIREYMELEEVDEFKKLINERVEKLKEV